MTEDSKNEMRTMQDLVREIFGEDAANDPEIVQWYEDVNKEAIAEAVEKGSIGFADWINDNGHIYGDNWWGGSLSQPANELYKRYQQYLLELK